MTYTPYPKGSEWNKWDLHVHTPASFHWNGGKRFNNMTEEEKNKSLEELHHTIEESDIAVFSFTDYWTFIFLVASGQFVHQYKYHCSYI